MFRGGRTARHAQRNSLRCGAGRAGVFRMGAATAGPVTVRFPNEVAQFEHTNSCNSPLGKTKRRRSRTGCETLHLGQYSSLAVNLPNCCVISSTLHDVPQKIKQHLVRGLVRVNAMFDFLVVEI